MSLFSTVCNLIRQLQFLQRYLIFSPAPLDAIACIKTPVHTELYYIVSSVSNQTLIQINFRVSIQQIPSSLQRLSIIQQIHFFLWPEDRFYTLWSIQWKEGRGSILTDTSDTRE